MKNSGMRKWIKLAVALVFLCPDASQGWDSTPAPSTFFKKTYDKSAKISKTYQETFPLLVEMPVADPALGTNYLISVQTDPGALKGKNIVEVRLNGELIADTAALRTSGSLSRSFTPLSENHQEVVLQGPDANFVHITATCSNCVPIQNISPADAETVNDPAITVQGDIVGIFEPELGVSVWNIDPETGRPSGSTPANVAGYHFVANQVPLVEGENFLSITVNGAQSSDYILSQRSFTLSYDPPPGYVQLSAQPESGLAPFEVNFKAEFSRLEPATTSVSCQGPAPVEVVPAETGYSALFPKPGPYTCTLDVTAGNGEHYQDSVEVTALSREEMDALLVGKWGGMKAALTEGNVEQAVDYFAIGSREVFRNQFAALSAVLPQIGQDLQSIRLVEMTDNRAIYDLRKIHDGTEYSFQVEFVKDEDGIWRLRTF